MVKKDNYTLVDFPKEIMWAGKNIMVNKYCLMSISPKHIINGNIKSLYFSGKVIF